MANQGRAPLDQWEELRNALTGIRPVTPSFEGLDHEDPEDYLRKCEAFFTRARIDEDQKVPTLQQALRGEARKWWAPFEFLDLPFEEFQRLVRARWNDTGEKGRLLAKLYGNQQKPNERTASTGPQPHGPGSHGSYSRTHRPNKDDVSSTRTKFHHRSVCDAQSQTRRGTGKHLPTRREGSHRLQPIGAALWSRKKDYPLPDGTRATQTSGAPLPRTGFPAELKPQVDKVLRDFEHVLMPGPGRLVGTKTIQHEIHLTNPRPFQLTPYRYSEDKRIEIERQVQEMLANGVIEPSNSPYNSPIVLAKKKGGQWRFCIDFRRLNELTVDTAQQIPRISDALKDLGEATVFSTLDLKSGYWQIPMAPEAGKYTAFTTPTGGAYQFRVMPTKKQLLAFLGTCNWLQEYVPRLATTLAPLTDLLREKRGLRWTGPAQRAFEEVKTALNHPLRLARPLKNEKYILQTDASSRGMGAVLFQQPEGEGRRIIAATIRIRRTLTTSVGYRKQGELIWGRPRKGTPWRLYVPTAIRPELLLQYHDSAEAGHPGSDETHRALQRHFYWRGMQQDVRSHIRDCNLCGRVKKASSHPAPISSHTPTEPWKHVALDLMGPYPTTAKQHRYILVITDLFSRWVETFPVRAADATTILGILEREIFPRWGFPQAILTDNGTQFSSKKWTETLQRWQITPWTTAVYHPRANPTERRNQEIKTALRLRLADRAHDTWDEDEELPQIMFQLRNRQNAATGQSPAFALLGRNLLRPGEWKLPLPFTEERRESTGTDATAPAGVSSWLQPGLTLGPLASRTEGVATHQSILEGERKDTQEPKITATGRGIPEGHPLPRRASPGQVHSGAREGGHPCPGRLQPGEGEAPPRPAVPGPHSARSSGDPPATQRLEGQEGEREVGSRESTNSCEEDPGEEVAPSIPQILRHRGTDPYCRLTPQHQEEKGPCDSLPHGTF
ncbi:unnamed protein product [Trichogramma brassicae]|uniref:RNA-directed DNA polymerase n=1 Tax=Trichogramma brassicae TaxID=86971 RepID=A0A6H5IHA9_9HYME|nr:unnamed protein product [Trichogramma brassicae]